MEQRDNLSEIKEEVKDNIGKKVILKADKGRKRIITSEGIIVDAYPSLFTVRVNNEYDVEKTVSYTYSDVLTSTVKLKFVN